jgi:outer membrane receptor protein involved in Fe transport
MEAVPVPLEKNKRLSAKIRLDKHFASGSVLTFDASALDYKGKTWIGGGGRYTWLDMPVLQARVNYKSPHWNIFVYAWKSDWEGIILSSGSNSFIDNYRIHGEVQGFTNFAKGKGRIVGGFSLRREGVDTANEQGIQTILPEPIDNHTEAVFGQLDYSITEKLKVVLAGRLDFSSLHKTRISPKASVVYTFNPGHSLRLSFNQAFLAIDYAYLYSRIPVAPPVDLSAIENGLSAAFDRNLGLGFSSIPVLVLGSENLNPEEITSFEMGYSNIFGRKLLFNINYYRNQLKNFRSDLLPFVNPEYGPYAPPSDLPSEIQTAILETLEQNLPPEYFAIMSNSLEDGSPIFAAASVTNTGRINTQGIELALKYFFNKHLSSFFNYAWFDWDVVEEFVGSTRTPNTPEHRFSLGASYIADRFDISMRYRWVDDFLWAGSFNGNVKSYNLVDLTANAYFGDGFGVGINISNLLNHKHYQTFGGDILPLSAVASGRPP